MVSDPYLDMMWSFVWSIETNGIAKLWFKLWGRLSHLSSCLFAHPRFNGEGRSMHEASGDRCLTGKSKCGSKRRQEQRKERREKETDGGREGGRRKRGVGEQRSLFFLLWLTSSLPSLSLLLICWSSVIYLSFHNHFNGTKWGRHDIMAGDWPRTHTHIHAVLWLCLKYICISKRNHLNYETAAPIQLFPIKKSKSTHTSFSHQPFLLFGFMLCSLSWQW